MGELRGDWLAQVVQARSVSPFAAELSALHEGELDELGQFLLSRPRLPFRYLSIHGPSKGRALSEAVLVDRLRQLAPFADGIVMHPDTIDEPELYRPLGRLLILENMDARKERGRTASELSAWFDALPEAGFCFDIAHAWSIDDTMEIAGELLDAFGSRLRHLHVSSLSTGLHHETLSEEHEELFTPLLQRCVDVPWILEAPPRAV